MPVLRNIGLLATCRDEGTQDDIHAIEDAALVWEGDTISWVGSDIEIPSEHSTDDVWDAGGNLVVPGLIDCHTHLAFAGTRQDEFVMRVLGKSYLEIAEAGGGIASTVKTTREASLETLTEQCLGILEHMKALGVTTVECKSGYGLDTETELRLLEVYDQLSEIQPLTIVPTFLGAHTIPPEHKESREEYIALLHDEMLPKVSENKLAEFCDIFVEDGAFSPDEARAILNRASELGFKLKLHVDQLSDIGGAALAVEVGAVSADHLERISKDGITALAGSNITAVTLPIASLYTFQTPLNARKLLEKGIPVAVATDFNPGSAPSYVLPFAMVLACTLNRMTPNEVLKGVTITAAKAICRADRLGSIEPGKAADFAIIESPDVPFWMYHHRENTCIATIKNGTKVFERSH